MGEKPMLLDFPTKGVRVDVLRNQLLQRIDDLKEHYKCIDDIHEQLNTLEMELSKLEKEVSTLEQSYDVVLSEYVPLVEDRLEVQFLSYSPTAILDADADNGITLRFGENGIPIQMDTFEDE